VNERAPKLERAGLVVALLLTACLAWPLRHYVTDDTYIHLRYAQQVARGEGFVFNTGDHVYGTTSPLWVLALAEAMALGLDGLLASKLLGALATLAALVLWWALVRHTLRSPWLRACSTVAWAGHAWMLRWSLSGMETPLAVSLVLAGCVAFTANRPWGARAGWASVLWALAGLTRPECALLLPLWALLLVVDHGGRRGIAAAVRGLWPGALVLGGWLVFAAVWFGRLWPNTLAAKAAGGVGLAYHLEQLARQAGIVAATDAAVGLVALALLGRRLARRDLPALRPAVRFLPWVWMVAVPLLYAVRGVPVLSRYLVPLLPMLAWLAWRLLDAALASARPGLTAAGRRDPAWGAALAVIVLAQNLVVLERVVRPQVDSFTAGMHASLEPWGRWLATHTPADAVIAAPDIGALGYLSQRRVVDLAGLVTPAMVPILRTVSPEDAVARFEFSKFSRPDVVVDRADEAWDLQRRSPWAAALTPLGTATIPNLGVARPTPAVYSFYRIDWAVVDSIATARTGR
jgi:arabinofuranosyltransferase